MKTEFKVMPWLRALRDRNAKEQAGLTIDERLRRSQKRGEPLLREFQRSHPEAFADRKARPLAVAEEHVHYGTRTRRKA
jgi:hypothetical protein